MAKIFVADHQPTDSFIQNLLKPKHELVVATNLTEAVATLKAQSFDLILIDLHFDDSRMFDLMHELKTISENASKPVICIAQKPGQLHGPVNDSLQFTTTALGAWMFLDVEKYRDKRDPKEELSRIIERCLVAVARKATSKARNDMHKRREEIHRLRTLIETEDWSEDSEVKLVELRRKLAALLLELCDVNIGNIAQQDQVDESRALKDRVSDSVTAAEDKATKGERKQSLNEHQHAVEELQIAEREEASKNRDKQEKK